MKIDPINNDGMEELLKALKERNPHLGVQNSRK